MSGESEPRRSVRATKGQHTKSFDELEPPAAPKRRQTKKTKKAQEQDQEEDQEEIIRCVCGATEQDEDSGEAWISCETCYCWQHNVCVGVSSYEDEIPENYWCERCKPQNHKELLDGISRGEKPWEARRKAHEEETEKKKRKGGRKPKGKRTSDTKEDLEKGKPSPKPETAGTKEKDSGKPTKRKARDDSQEVDGKSNKSRRVSENDNLSRPIVKYTPPDDLPTAIQDLPGTRVGPAKALKKSLAHVMSKESSTLDLPEGSTVDAMAEVYALQIERAVFDTHPVTKSQKEYGQQIRSLTFNLKNNPEVCRGLLQGVHTPSTLAVMTSEQLASAELLRQTAEMRARTEKQSILENEEKGPRVRRTHKGEEYVEDESQIQPEAPPPPPVGSRRTGRGQQPGIKRESMSDEQQIELPARPSSQSGEARSPSNPNFDIGKVFSSVKSPTIGGPPNRRPSGPVLEVNTNGPGDDPDVDRMLQDDNESPPYSPTEESQDPDVVWRGSLAMSSIADFVATARHVGGANFSSIGPWSRLIPNRMTVAGRIAEQSAIEYLCSLRYSTLTDIVVVSLTPASPEFSQEWNALIDYFVAKKRYGVVGDKVAGNVRDTYLVPVPPGDDNQPEFMMNLVDNSIPKSRTEPMLLAVFVYRNEPEQVKTNDVAQPVRTPSAASPTAPPGASIQQQQRSNSTSGPSFSPATPQASSGSFTGRIQSTTPVPIPQPPGARPTPPAVSPPQTASAQPQQPQHQHQPPVMTEAEKFQAQQSGEKQAREILGPLVSVPTAQFLLPQAFQMKVCEWEVIKRIYERDMRAREDLQHLGALLEKEPLSKAS